MRGFVRLDLLMRGGLWLTTSALVAIGCSPMPRNSALHWDAATTTAPVVEPADDDAGVTPSPEPPRDVAVEINAPDLRDVAAPEAAAESRPATAMCVLKVTVTTRTTNRAYAPRNVGAIWIADQAGKFVKSLNVWANRRLGELEKWAAATRAAGVANNRVDAVTAATMNNHAVRTGTWNCTDVSKVVVPDGSYQVCFEMNETNGTSEYQCVPFNKSDTPQTAMPPDAPAFRTRTIEYTP